MASVCHILQDDIKMQFPSWECHKCWPTDTRLHREQCIMQCGHLTKAWMMLSVYQLSHRAKHGCCFFFNPETKWHLSQWKSTPQLKKCWITTTTNKTMATIVLWDPKVSLSPTVSLKLWWWPLHSMKTCWQQSFFQHLSQNRVENATIVHFHHSKASIHWATHMDEARIRSTEWDNHALYYQFVSSEVLLIPMQSFLPCISDFPMGSTYSSSKKLLKQLWSHDIDVVKCISAKAWLLDRSDRCGSIFTCLA